MALSVSKALRGEVIDPHNQVKRYESMKGKPIKGIDNVDSDIILKYIRDMELGINVTGRKGSRSHVRLNTIRYRMKTIAEYLNKSYSKSLLDATSEEIMDLFNNMKKGVIKKKNGSPYESVADYTKAFKAFWRWHMRVERNNGNSISNIAIDLDTVYDNKPKFTYFTFEQLKLLANNSKYKYKVMFWFLFDSGVRSPSELANIKVSDFFYDEEKDILQLNVRDEISKTFGRKIKLLHSKQLVLDYIKNEKLKRNDYLFSVCSRVINRYLQRNGAKLFGFDNLTLYDFRHSSACYWYTKYKSETLIKYRFGWKKSDMIQYYTNFLGITDTISEDDLVDSDERTKYQKELEKEKQQRIILQEKMDEYEKSQGIIVKLLLKNMKSKKDLTEKDFDDVSVIYNNL